MRLSFFICCFHCLFLTAAMSQKSPADVFAAAKKADIDQFISVDAFDSEDMTLRVLIEMPYASPEIIDQNTINELKRGEILEINLYYTDFPKGRNLDQLNTNRINNLIEAYPAILDSNYTWSIYRQMACQTMAEADSMFHGFEILIDIQDSKDLAYYHVVKGTKDLVVEDVLDRQSWDSMLVVADFTGSMTRYISQLLLWIKLNNMDGKVNQFVFFNDGNGRAKKFKRIGKTGGIHQTKSKVYAEIEKVAKACKYLGDGGDIPENDIEALLAGINLCPDCNQVVLIADNRAPMRDIQLMTQIDRPVRVILCGVEDEINLEYLNLARITGGSIHLIEQDIDGLLEMKEGDVLEVKGIYYIIQKGAFVKLA